MSGISPSFDADEHPVAREVANLRSYFEDATTFAIFDPAALRTLLWRRDDITAALDEATRVGNVLLVRNDAKNAARGIEAVFRLQMNSAIPQDLQERCQLELDGAVLNVPSGRLFVNAAASHFLRAQRAWNGEPADYEPRQPYAGESIAIAAGTYSLRVWKVNWETGQRSQEVQGRISPEHLRRHNRHSMLMLAGSLLTIAALSLPIGLSVYFALRRQWAHAIWSLTVLPFVYLLLRIVFRIPASARYAEAAAAVRAAEVAFPHAIVEMTPIDDAVANGPHTPSKCGWVFVK